MASFLLDLSWTYHGRWTYLGHTTNFSEVRKRVGANRRIMAKLSPHDSRVIKSLELHRYPLGLKIFVRADESGLLRLFLFLLRCCGGISVLTVSFGGGCSGISTARDRHFLSSLKFAITNFVIIGEQKKKTVVEFQKLLSSEDDDDHID